MVHLKSNRLGMNWTSVKEKLPSKQLKKYLVKTINQENIPAFFMHDAARWINFYGLEPSNWMEAETGNLIYNVTHWMLLPKNEE